MEQPTTNLGSNGSTRSPLQGVRVLDLTRVLAGPYCTMILADLGAEVVKVERPQTGDDARHFGPFLPSGQSAYFASINRGKKSITLDLKRPSDRELFLELSRQTDVVVENFRAGAMTALQLSAELLQEQNPRLIYASLTGFGLEGLDVDRAAYDVVIQAMSGLMSITGAGPGQFVRVGTSISDLLTGLYGVIGICAALHQRETTGRGTILDLAMLDCTVSALENAVSRYAVSGQSPEPLGTRHPSITPFQAFQAADAPLVVAAGNDVLWRKLCHTLDCDHLADDTRLCTNDARTQNRDYLEEQLNGYFQQASQAEWLDKLRQQGVPSAPIRNMEQVVADEHLASRGMWHQMQDGQGGSLLTAGSPLRMDGRSPELSDLAPELDEHRETILAQWLQVEEG